MENRTSTKQILNLEIPRPTELKTCLHTLLHNNQNLHNKWL